MNESMRSLKQKKGVVIAAVCIFTGILFVLASIWISGIFDREYDEHNSHGGSYEGYDEIEKISKLIEENNKELSKPVNEKVISSSDSEENAPDASETSQPISEKNEVIPESATNAFISPIDFDKVRAVNEDIIAWIAVADKNINYPVLYAANEYYLRRKYDKTYSESGSIFIESEYNSKSFDDPVTVIYGHQMKDGTMFSNLAGCLNERLDDDSVFMIYSESELRTYRIFAAVQYSEEHILYYNDFSDEKVFDSFFDEIFNSRSFAANIDKSVDIKQGNIVILSTCFLGNSRKRYLVIGVCTDIQVYFTEELK